MEHGNWGLLKLGTWKWSKSSDEGWLGLRLAGGRRPGDRGGRGIDGRIVALQNETNPGKRCSTTWMDREGATVVRGDGEAGWTANGNR